MRPRKSAAEDNWHGISDARRRKQIQDRLAQRARRQRLANAAKSSKSVPGPSTSAASPSPKSSPRESFCSIVDPVKVSYPSPESEPPSGDPRLSSDPALKCSDLTPTPKSQISIEQEHAAPPVIPGQLSVYSAIYTNGRILGIPCVTTLATKSKPQPPEVPASLHPLPIQLNEVHFNFIDRFPLPQLRYNMIAMADEFSAEEFIADLFGMPSFEIRPGGEAWETEAWSVMPEFKAKWAFLFEENGNVESRELGVGDIAGVTDN